MEIDIKPFIESLKEVELVDDPKLGDFHAANTTSVYPEEYDRAIIEDPKHAKHLRGIGKTVGLSLLYGGSEYTISDKLGITMADATPIIVKFYENLPTLKKFHVYQKGHAKKYQESKNIFGGIRYLPGIELDQSQMFDAESKKRQFQKRSKMERLALNAPIQSASSLQVMFIILAVNKYIEDNKMNRTYGNLRHTYKPYTRIVGIEANASEELVAALEELPTGHVKFVVTEGDQIVEEFDRNLQITERFMEEHGLGLVW